MPLPGDVKCFPARCRRQPAAVLRIVAATAAGAAASEGRCDSEASATPVPSAAGQLGDKAPLLGGARCALAPAVAVLRHLTACVPQRPCATAIERDLKKWLSFKLLCWLVYNPTLKCAVAGQLQGDFHLRMQSVKRPLGGMEAGGLLFTVVVNRQPE